jgi:hypothetical protein
VITNLAQVRNHHRRFLDQHDDLVDGASDFARAQAHIEVQTNPPFKPRSGALQRSVETKFVRTSTGALVRVSSNARIAPHNRVIEHGSKAHVIRSRRGALRFVWHGTVMFRRSVNHPGTKPYYFLRAATYAAGHALETRLRLGMLSLAKRF